MYVCVSVKIGGPIGGLSADILLIVQNFWLTPVQRSLHCHCFWLTATQGSIMQSYVNNYQDAPLRV